MKKIEITDTIEYIGVDDKTIELFENQYSVPNGISYNSYLIKDEKNVVMDTVDKRQTNQWIENLEKALDGQTVDYLVVSHMEPDHAYNIQTLVEMYPDMKLIGNEKTFAMISQFFSIENLEEKKIVVKEEEKINIGKHTLQFFMAPMVHWPEVMMTYEKSEKILFSADAFGKFGRLDKEENWEKEARRYYFNIVGKYGMQVQAILKKIAPFEMEMICPLHGPILNEKLEYYLEKYNTWSRYKPEKEGIVIAYASIYGNTQKVAEELWSLLKEKGMKKVLLKDLVKENRSEVLSDVFCYSTLVLASSSYNAGLFPPMEHFLNELVGKNYQNRTIGIIENGTWAPSAAKSIKEKIEQMKNITLCDTVVTIRSTMKEQDRVTLEKLAEELIQK